MDWPMSMMKRICFLVDNNGFISGWRYFVIKRRGRSWMIRIRVVVMIRVIYIIRLWLWVIRLGGIVIVRAFMI